MLAKRVPTIPSELTAVESNQNHANLFGHGPDGKKSGPEAPNDFIAAPHISASDPRQIHGK
jgi:hypothetical protein